MDDKSTMEALLNFEKGICDLYLHGSIESSTTNVHQAFQSALSQSLTMQNDLYQKMTQKGWYPSEQVEQNKMQQVKQKFSSGC